MQSVAAGLCCLSNKNQGVSQFTLAYKSYTPIKKGVKSARVIKNELRIVCGRRANLPAAPFIYLSLSAAAQPLLYDVFDCHNRGIMCSKNTRRSIYICARDQRKAVLAALYLGLTRYYNARASNNVTL